MKDPEILFKPILNGGRLLLEDLNACGYLPASTEPADLCRAAAQSLQVFLTENHICSSAADPGLFTTGKMFGVLVAATADGVIGYLAAFSGKLDGKNDHPHFVPPVYDGLMEDGFLTSGMLKLADISTKIRELESSTLVDPNTLTRQYARRKDHSRVLQSRLFEAYHFVNSAGETRDLRTLFSAAGRGEPPAGAGECAGPKLLNYANIHGLRPLALAEFWWGVPKGRKWQHLAFYPSCADKCAPIMKFLEPTERR